MTKDEALELALNALHTKGEHHPRVYEAIAAIQTVLKQPVQEPVACRFCHSKKGCWTWQCYHCGEIDDVQQPATPQRQWVGLTDEEMSDIVADIDVDFGDLLWKVVCLTKIIEATLKERNT